MYLNIDVATEILLHLPVQSLIRFRRVCKCWCNIIDSSTFRTSHLHNQLGNNDGETLFLHFYRGSTWEVSILNVESGKRHKGFPAFQEFSNNNIGSGTLFVTGAVNGLFCVYNDFPYLKGGNPTIGIYNPCLDKVKILPPSPVCSSIAYEFDRAEIRRQIGFGLDNATKDYKLVQLISIHKGPTFVEVYSGTTNTWRKLDTGFNFVDYNLSIYGVEVIKSKSGSWAHWKTYRQDHVYVILSFNMQNEVFETIPYPNFDRVVFNNGSWPVFAKDDDSLALFVLTLYDTLEVWEVESKDKKRCWTHVKDFKKENIYFPRALWKKDMVVWIEYGCEQHESIIFYNYYTREVIKRCEMPKVMPNIYTMDIFEYKGSLILP